VYGHAVLHRKFLVEERTFVRVGVFGAKDDALARIDRMYEDKDGMCYADITWAFAYEEVECSVKEKKKQVGACAPLRRYSGLNFFILCRAWRRMPLRFPTWPTQSRLARSLAWWVDDALMFLICLGQYGRHSHGSFL
jgi:hypothetical protein